MTYRSLKLFTQENLLDLLALSLSLSVRRRSRFVSGNETFQAVFWGRKQF